MDNSEFLPPACSTVNRKNMQKKTLQNLQHTFEEDNGDSFLTENSYSNASYQLEEQKSLARSSLHRAKQVSRIPSKYLRPNDSNFESDFCITNESTISESDLLKNTSTPCKQRNSILKDSLAHLSYKISDNNVSIDDLVTDFKNAFKTASEQGSTIFTPAEELESMLMADEMSWKRKNVIPIQDEQFSEINSTGLTTIGEFFNKRSDKISDILNCESFDGTKEPIALVEPSFKIEETNKSASLSMIQRLLESDETPKRTFDKLCKLGSKPEANLTIQTNTRVQSNQNYSIPLSKNSSYTSDHSENEIMKELCSKENIDSLNIKNASNSPPTSRSSSRASSSLTSLQNDKLPIETSKCDLIWGCVKLGKSVSQEFILRNRSTKRLHLQLSLGSQEFKLRKDNRTDNEALSSSKIVLHPNESKSVTVSFIPTKVGAAIDELYFTSLSPKLIQSKKQCIKLFGYGGSVKIDMKNLTRDTTGKFWLSLGKLDNSDIISSSFNVKNRGDLPAFMYISINSLESSKININPNFFVIMPQEEKSITVSYKPSSEDYNFFHKSLHNTEIIDIGGLNIIYGAEADRGRIRKLCDKCVDNSVIPQIVNNLRESIVGESMPHDLIKFKEPLNYLKDMVKFLNNYQIILTLERDPEQTIIQQYTDDSGLYQSLYQETTVICNKNEVQRTCCVAPTIVVLTLPYKHKDLLYIKSDNDKKLKFLVSCEEKDLELKPREGFIDPHGTVIVRVKYSLPIIQERRKFLVVVIIENEIFEVEVKVESLGTCKNKNKSVLDCML